MKIYKKNALILKLILLNIFFISSTYAFDFKSTTTLFSKASKSKSHNTKKTILILSSAAVLLGPTAIFLYLLYAKNKTKPAPSNEENNNNKNIANLINTESINVQKNENAKITENNKNNLAKSSLENKKANPIESNSEKQENKSLKPVLVPKACENLVKNQEPKDLKKNPEILQEPLTEVEQSFVEAWKNNDTAPAVKFLEEINLDKAKKLTNNFGSKNNYKYHLSNSYYSTKLIQLLISISPDINKIYSYIGTPLCCACNKDNPEKAVLLFLENGANINKPGFNGDTPLHLACWHNDLKLAKLLLKRGAIKSINSFNKHETTPLYNATCKTNIEIIFLLLSNGAMVNSIEIEMAKTTPILLQYLTITINLDNSNNKFGFLDNTSDVNGSLYYDSDKKFKESLYNRLFTKHNKVYHGINKSLNFLNNKKGILKYSDCAIITH